MHNRLRMIVASFLTKDLLVDWRLGEKHFADTLIDFDLASNNGGWQWAASTGCDAQPYFRIFNPVTQSERFDADGKFIRRYVPEVAALDAREIHAPWTVPPAIQQAKGVVIGRDYPPPIVDHAVMRVRALALYGREGSDPVKAPATREALKRRSAAGFGLRFACSSAFRSGFGGEGATGAVLQKLPACTASSVWSMRAIAAWSAPSRPSTRCATFATAPRIAS